MIDINTVPIRLLAQLHKQPMSQQEHRGYLGMSGIGRCPREQYFKFVNGPDESDRMIMYAYTGYLHESDLKRRLVALDIARVDQERAGIDARGVYLCGTEKALVAPWDERFRGHTDGETTDGRLLELKSINDKGFKNLWGRPKDEHLAQVQTYMHYGAYATGALVVYVNRESFEHCAFDVKYDPEYAQANDEKARLILSAIDRQEPPDCTCGWCKE